VDFITDTSGVKPHEPFNDLCDHDGWKFRELNRKRTIVIVRTTGKLAKQIGLPSLDDVPLAKNLLADWTCRVFTVWEKELLMLITNTASLYSLLVPANGLENLEQFDHGLIRYLERHMLSDGFEDVFREHLVPELKTIQFAKSLNRSVTGSMTDMVKLAGYMLVEDGNSPEQVAGRLNETPFGAIDYDHPRERFFKLAEQAIRSRN
jgi:hypothetical protein